MSKVENQAKKKRELELGLANNAFGAAAGVAATKMAWDKAKNIDPDSYGQKPINKPPKAGFAGKLLKKTKIPSKVAIPVLGAGIIGGQLANAGMDAQSGYYFGRERAKMMKKPPMQTAAKSYESLSKSYEGPERGTGIGYSLLDKATPRSADEREARRQRNLGRSEVGGYLAAGGAGLTGGRLLADRFAPRIDPTHLSPVGQGTLGPDARRVAGFKEAAMGTGKRKLKLVGHNRLNPKFAGGAALLAAAPAIAVGTKRMSDSGKERWR